MLVETLVGIESEQGVFVRCAGMFGLLYVKREIGDVGIIGYKAVRQAIDRIDYLGKIGKMMSVREFYEVNGCYKILLSADRVLCSSTKENELQHMNGKFDYEWYKSLPTYKIGRITYDIA